MNVILQGLNSSLLITQGFGVGGYVPVLPTGGMYPGKTRDKKTSKKASDKTTAENQSDRKKKLKDQEDNLEKSIQAAQDKIVQETKAVIDNVEEPRDVQQEIAYLQEMVSRLKMLLLTLVNLEEEN